jgi:hypothetical protein
MPISVGTAPAYIYYRPALASTAPTQLEAWVFDSGSTLYHRTY